MDERKNHREEAPRRPRQETPANSRSQPSTEAPKRRSRPQEPSQAAPKQRPGSEGAAAPKRRLSPENAPEAKRRPRPEEAAAPKRRPAQEEGTTPKRPQTDRSVRQPSSAPTQSPGQTEAPGQNKQRRTAPRQIRGPEQQKTPPKTRKTSDGGKKPAQPSREPAKTRKAPRSKQQPDDLSSKKRAYGNSKPKKKSAFAVLGQAISASAQQSAAKRRARLERQGKRSKRDSGQPMPAVIYTQPQAFNRDRLLVQLVTVTAVVVAFVVGLSIFFKVRHIRVSGADVYTAWAVEEASGIKEGDNLLTFSRARAGALIKANLPYVKNVSFGIKLPDTVNIIIEEEDVVYAIKDQDEQWWLINSSGRVVEQAKKGAASNYTQIVGVALDHPLKDQAAMAVEALTVAQEPGADPTAETTEPVVAPPTVSGAQRLNIALQILRALEDNDIVGNAASINVSQIQGITLWYGTRYQVNLGDSANLEYKIACMNSVIMNMQEYQSGVLDCSFTVWPDQVGYTPFS